MGEIGGRLSPSKLAEEGSRMGSKPSRKSLSADPAVNGGSGPRPSDVAEEPPVLSADKPLCPKCIKATPMRQKMAGYV